MKKWIRSQFRKKSRVYILPTRMGGYFNGLLFLMFLLAVGYSNNLLLIFTIFLFGFNLIWLIQTHFHLYHLNFDSILIDSGHARSAVHVRINWRNCPDLPVNWSFEIETEDEDFKLAVINNGPEFSSTDLIVARRGLYKWRYLKVSTDRPFGLYRTWIYFPLKQDSIFFPPLLSKIAIDPFCQVISGEGETDYKGPEDFRSLGPYDNVESKKISWKHYARTGDLLIKEGFRPSTSSLELKFNEESYLSNHEQYLSWLATQMVECYRQGIPFSFKFQDKLFPSQSDAFHLKNCLRELSLC